MKKQKLLVLAAGALICWVLYPPWHISDNANLNLYGSTPPRPRTDLEWSLIINPPSRGLYPNQSAAIAFGILTLEVLALAAATFAAHLITWDKRR